MLEPTIDVRDPTVPVTGSDCRIAVLRRRRTHNRIGRWRVDLPQQPYWRLYWNPEPGAWVERQRRRWRLDPDRVVMIAPRTRFRAGLDHPVEHAFAHVTLGRPFDDAGPLIVERAVDRVLGDLLAVVFEPEAAGVEPPHLPPLLAIVALVLAEVHPRVWPALPRDPAVSEMCRLLEQDPARR